MSSKRRALGDVAWDIAWGLLAAMVLARGLSGSWIDAVHWVLLALILLGVSDALNEWRDVFPRWVETRRKRRAAR